MYKKLLSFFAAIIILLSGVKLGKSESDTVVPPINATDITEEQKSLAEELFGWKDTGDLYMLSNAIIVKIKVDGIDKKILCEADSLPSVMYYNEQKGSLNSMIFRDLITKEIIYIRPTDGDRPICSKEYFGEQEAKVLGGAMLLDYIKDKENYEELRRRMYGIQTLEWVVETMLLMDEDWYTIIEEEYIFSGNVPLDRDGELMIDYYTNFLQISFGEEKKALLVESYKDDNGNTRFRELFTKIDFSDVKYKKINPVFLELFGVKSLSEKNMALNFMSGMVSRYPELTKPLRESLVDVDGRKLMTIKGLACVYDRLPEELKIDFDRLMELAGI